MDSMRDVLRSFLAKPGRKLRPKPPPPPQWEPWLDLARLRIAKEPELEPPPEPARPPGRHGARHHYRPTTARYAQDGP